MKHLIAVFVVVISTFSIADQIVTRGIDHSGLLTLATKSRPDDIKMAQVILKGHLLRLEHLEFITNVIQSNTALKEISAIKKLSDDPLSAAKMLKEAMHCEIIPDTFIIRIDVDRNLFANDSKKIIDAIGDAYRAELLEVYFNRDKAELELASQWTQRYQREYEIARDELVRLEKSEDKKVDLERASAAEKIQVYKKLIQEMEDRVASIKSRMATDNAELVWLAHAVNG